MAYHELTASGAPLLRAPDAVNDGGNGECAHTKIEADSLGHIR